MPQHTEKLAVMFADICGSTSLYDRLGDEMARRLIAKCIAIMVDKVTACQGTLIKTIGDEIMCTFPSAENAMNAACIMQTTIENGNHGEEHPMHIRIGFHYGDVICEAGDVFGDTVNVAARVASITRASQILTTMAAANSLPPELRNKTYQTMRAELKGKQEQQDIFRVAWEADDTLRTRIGTPTYRKLQDGNGELTLRYREQSFKINEQHKSAVLGREEVCDILVQHDFASRQHARIEARFGKFIIADQSTNGTYVRFTDGHSVRLAREELVLHGSGSISLGQAFSENPSDVVEFSIGPAPA
jgi:class 3 adenylate cyclase